MDVVRARVPRAPIRLLATAVGRTASVSLSSARLGHQLAPSMPCGSCSVRLRPLSVTGAVPGVTPPDLPYSAHISGHGLYGRCMPQQGSTTAALYSGLAMPMLIYVKSGDKTTVGQASPTHWPPCRNRHTQEGIPYDTGALDTHVAHVRSILASADPGHNRLQTKTPPSYVGYVHRALRWR